MQCNRAKGLGREFFTILVYFVLWFHKMVNFMHFFRDLRVWTMAEEFLHD
jgi:hypothetical protein